MTIPFATTTITVLRSDQDGTKDLRSALTYSTLASGVRAHVGSPGGSETVSGGSREDVTAHLDCDPTDLAHADRVLDDTTGITYEVTWAAARHGLGLDHVEADLRLVTDRVST